MNLTYSNAWLWVDSMNQLAPSPLVVRTTGGVGGGKAIVTEEGLAAIQTYKDLRDKLGDAFDAEVSEDGKF